MEDFGEHLGYMLKWEKDQSILSSLALLLRSPKKSVITHGSSPLAPLSLADPPLPPHRKLPSRATSNLLIARIQKNTLAHYWVRRPNNSLDPRRQAQSILYRRCMMLAWGWWWCMLNIPARPDNTTAEHIPAYLERRGRHVCCSRGGVVVKKGSNGFGFDVSEK